MSSATVSTRLSYHVPAVLAPFPRLIAAESTRHSGLSPTPFASLNLGINTADDPARVNENRRRFFEAIGATANQFASSYQVHGTEILCATEPGQFDGYDALITDQPGLLVGVTVADCAPILIYDHENQAVAAIHAGWRGTVGGIVTKALAAMQQRFNTTADQCYAYVGTCIDQNSFDVGVEVADQFAADFIRYDVRTGKGYVDLKRANTQSLIDFGIPLDQISVSPFSTVLNNEDYFSHRAEQGQTGRMLAVISIKPQTKVK